jgi:hypothetical protein
VATVPGFDKVNALIEMLVAQSRLRQARRARGLPVDDLRVDDPELEAELAAAEARVLAQVKRIEADRLRREVHKRRREKERRAGILTGGMGRAAEHSPAVSRGRR